MYRSTFLAPTHYAGKWIIPEEDQRNDLKAVNALGYAYAVAPDSPAKEAKLLEVLECFHGYLNEVPVHDRPGYDSAGEFASR